VAGFASRREGVGRVLRREQGPDDRQAGRVRDSALHARRRSGPPHRRQVDWLATVYACFADLKTTADGEAKRFGILAHRYGYNLQSAFYRRVLALNGLDLPPKIITVESAEPHDVAVFGVDEDALYFADAEITELLRRVADCTASGKWPGRYETAEERLALPSWAFPQDDDGVTGLDLVVPATMEE
jgi:hypothetical protein